MATPAVKLVFLISFTNHRIPHKLFFLLSVMDMIAQGQVIENFIEPAFELTDTLNEYWNAVMPIGHQSTMAHPFPRLQYGGFWHRIANSGYNISAQFLFNSKTYLF
jgi:putative restriction endonuclease